ncbi:MAG: DUF1302 domain-containing protein [Parvibaculum sp.]|nr:DUF1302 domain-containing protein [Parvibaculum sp.]
MKRRSLRSVLLGSAAATMLIASAGTASAIEYNFGSVQVFFDTTLSAGASMRTAAINHEYLPTSNGGPLDSTPDTGLLGFPTTIPAVIAVNGGTTHGINAYETSVAGSINTDDGRLNFDKWDMTGNTYKMTNDIQAKWENYTFFARVNSYYDAVLASDSSYNRSELVAGEADAARDIRLLDFYASADYNVGQLPLNVRLGKQVISWGESTFLLNGVNSVNPIDVNAFRRPGAEIKEGLVPVWAVDASIGLPHNLSLEAFYQLKWEPFQLDRPGTPFSTSDVVSLGSGVGGNINATSFLTGGPGGGIFRNCLNPTEVSDVFQTAYNGSGNDIRDCTTGAYDFTGYNSSVAGLGGWTAASGGSTEALRLALGDTGVVRRDPDREASDSGQYGIAARWYSEDLNNTEFGFYFMNYHSRLPIASERIRVDPTTSVAGTYMAAGSTTSQQSRVLQYSGCNAALTDAVPNVNEDPLDPDDDFLSAAVLQPTANAAYGLPIGLSAETLDLLNNTVLDPDGVLAAGLAYADTFYQGTASSGVITPPAGSLISNAGFGSTTIVGTNLAAIAGFTGSPFFAGYLGMANPIVQANSVLALTIANCALVAQQSASLQPVLPTTPGDPAAAPYMLVDGSEILLASSTQADPAIGLYLEYPEDIKMYGFSFNTTLGTWGVQGDLTYRPNQPVQLDTDQITINALNRGCVFQQLVGHTTATNNFDPLDTMGAGCGSVTAGTTLDLQGYERTDIYTAQVGTTATFTASNPLIGFTGADLGILVTEVGAMYAPDAPSEGANNTVKRWGNVCASGGTDLPLGGFLALAAREGCRPTSVSWGYVLLGQLQYNNAFGTAVTLNPTMAFSHGVSGNSPAPLSNYRQGAKSLSLQLNGSYQSWRGGLSYTNYFGDEKYANNTDQDFVSMNISYAF